MARRPKAKETAPESAEIAVGAAVVVFPGTDREQRGVVTEDFGEAAGQPVDVADEHFADAARRWAVNLDNGELVFVDSDSLKLAEGEA